MLPFGAIHPSLAFRRARLQYVYSILRGKDLETGAFSDERREEQFAILAAPLAPRVSCRRRVGLVNRGLGRQADCSPALGCSNRGA